MRDHFLSDSCSMFDAEKTDNHSRPKAKLLTSLVKSDFCLTQTWEFLVAELVFMWQQVISANYTIRSPNPS